MHQSTTQGQTLVHRSLWKEVRRWRYLGVILVIAIGCGWLLGGCDFFDFAAELLRIDTNQAEAQQEIRIETVLIDPDSFLLLADQAPTIEVKDGATVYTLQSSGSLTFTPSGDTAQTLALDPGDVVIERPGVSISALTISRVP